MRRVARFVARLTDQTLTGWRPEIAERAIEQCHLAADGRGEPDEADLSAADLIAEAEENGKGAYTSPRWGLIRSALYVGFWAATWDQYDTDNFSSRRARREAAEYCLRAASTALNEAERMGINPYVLAELYLEMRYRYVVHPSLRDAALAALVAGHAEVADDIIRYGFEVA